MMTRRKFVRAASGLLVPASALASVPLPLGFFKPASGASCTAGYPACNVTGLVNWWKASDLSASDSDPIGTWTDSVGGVAATASGTTRPTYKTSIFGSQAVLRFDASNDTFSLGSTLTFDITAGFTILFVSAYNVAGTTNGWLLSQTGAYAGGVRLDGNGAAIHMADALNFRNSNNNGLNTTPQPAVYMIGYTSTVNFHVNKGSLGAAAGALTVNPTVNLIGSFQNVSNFLGGDLAELLVYNRELSSTERDALYDNYFKLKFTTLP